MFEKCHRQYRQKLRQYKPHKGKCRAHKFSLSPQPVHNILLDKQLHKMQYLTFLKEMRLSRLYKNTCPTLTQCLGMLHTLNRKPHTLYWYFHLMCIQYHTHLYKLHQLRIQSLSTPPQQQCSKRCTRMEHQSDRSYKGSCNQELIVKDCSQYHGCQYCKLEVQHYHHKFKM